MPEQTATEVHQQSGGVNVDASEVKVGNDVVERDKVESAGGPIIHAEPGSTYLSMNVLLPNQRQQ